jgi:hypothetical protein
MEESDCGPWIDRPSGPQYRSGRRGKEKIFDPTETGTPTPPSSSP